MRNPAIGVGRSVARVAVRRPSVLHSPGRPYTRRPYVAQPPVDAPPPTTQTPTTTSTGVTATSGGFMPGAPASTDIPAIYQPPKIKNWRKATPAQLAQASLAPQYASLAAQQHQAQLMSGQQLTAINSYGLDLAKILGTAGPGGQMPTLGPNYAASLTAANQRNFAYQQFLYQTKVADDHAKIAAQYPTLLNQFRAQQEGEKLKWAAFRYQQLVGNRAYGIDTQKMNAYNQATNARISQSGQRIQLERDRLKTTIGKFNAQQTTDANKIDWRGSIIAGRAVNASGTPLNVGISNSRFKAAQSKGSPSTKAGGGISPYQKTEIFDGAVTLATHLNDTRNPSDLSQPNINNPGGRAIQGREAYKRVRFYLKARYPNLKPAQLNQLTQAALVSGGYPKAPRHF